jgi:hypothetical protein
MWISTFWATDFWSADFWDADSGGGAPVVAGRSRQRRIMMVKYFLGGGQ